MNKNFWEFFISRNRFTMIILFAALSLGLFSIVQIPKESMPEVDIPVGIVSVPFPGASAQETEELITNILEDKLLSLDNIKEVASVSSEGISVVSVEFEAKSDSGQRILDLKDKVDEAKINFPDGAEDPIVRKIRFSDSPIYVFSISGPFQTAQLKKFAEELESELERIGGVSKVEIAGGKEREIQIIIDKARLDKYRLNIGQITNAIKLANADVPTGFIQTAGAKYNLRLQGRLFDADQIKKIPVSAINSAPILIEDVADIIDGYNETESISRLSVNGNPSLAAMSIYVYKSSGGNILRVVEQIEQKISEAKKNFLPKNVAIETIRDEAKYIRDDLRSLLINGSETILIVMFLLFLFLGWKESLLAGTAIPLSFLITFVFLSAFGMTLNFLSLFSLILALGILIDSSIVIVEGIHTRIKSGLAPQKAAILTVHDFKMPLIAGTLTTVFAFVPMLLMSGIMGQFIKHIPITVSIVLLSSLFVSLGLISTLAIKWLKNKKESETAKENRLLDKIRARYEKSLSNIILSKKLQKRLFSLIIFLFVFSLFLPISGILKVQMFPADDMDFFFIDLKMPVGTTLEHTSEIMKKIEQELYNDKNIKSFSVNIGSPAQAGNIGAQSSGSHLGNISVNLSEDRKEKSFIISENYQEKFAKIIDEGEIFTTHLGMGPGEGSPVEISITGKSLDTLEKLAEDFENIIKQIPGTINVQTSIQEPTGEFIISIDRIKAGLYGINTVELARILRNAISGTTATVIRKDQEEIDVIVKYALNPQTLQNGKTNIVNINNIEALTIATPKGNIPLSNFTTSELKGSRPSISHKNGRRVIKITSSTKSGTQAQEIFQKVSKEMKNLNIPSGYSVIMGGEAEELQQSYNDMYKAMILAIFLIAGALVLQFNSFRQPLFILAAIPLALIGVFPGLILAGLPITFPGIIGIVALVGIVVNNAIILIDKINKNRKENILLETAIIEAGKARLRPIVLTTITTVFGILPITLSNKVWGSLGFSIIFGLTFSTILTLFVVPLLYLRFARKTLNG